MVAPTTLTQARLKELLHYDPETGVFTWRLNRAPCLAGDVAGCVNKKSGYRFVTIDRKIYLAHRLAWLYVHGVLPPKLDHKNRCRDDNGIENLRAATAAENCQNMKMPGHNTSGLQGAFWHKSKKKWVSFISVSNKKHYVGTFADKHAAHAAYVAAKSRLHTFNPEL